MRWTPPAPATPSAPAWPTPWWAGPTWSTATRWAVRCGAAAVTRRGAQASLPTRAEVEALEARGDRRTIVIDTDPGRTTPSPCCWRWPRRSWRCGDHHGGGNVPLAADARATPAIVCELAGRPDVRVYAGADRPLVRPLVTAEYVHGRTGLDGADLPEPAMPAGGGARRRLPGASRCRRPRPGPSRSARWGPLTNIALALQRGAPEVAGRIREIVLMGGGFFEGGNATRRPSSTSTSTRRPPTWCSAAGCPSPCCPWTSPTRRSSGRATWSACGRWALAVGEAAAGWMEFFERYDVEKYGLAAAPCTIPA